MSTIDLNIVGTANFSSVEAAIAKLKAEMSALSTQMATMGTTPTMTAGVSAALKDFNNMVSASQQYRVHTVAASTEAERLSQRIVRNKTTFNDLKTAMTSVNKAGSQYLDLGKRQVALQSSLAIKTGETTYLYEKLNLQQMKSTQLTMAQAQAIAAQNAVLRQHAIQVVNWGKNMQWSGR